MGCRSGDACAHRLPPRSLVNSAGKVRCSSLQTSGSPTTPVCGNREVMLVNQVSTTRVSNISVEARTCLSFRHEPSVHVGTYSHGHVSGEIKTMRYVGMYCIQRG